MKLKRFIACLLTLLMLFAAAPVALAADSPYYIVVDVTNQITTIYSTADKSVVRQMLCSTGRHDKTPLGTFTIPQNRRSQEREEWYSFPALGLYAKYATRIVSKYLFHSLPFSDTKDSKLIKADAALLGTAASHGCVRLRVEDAKFIAENCLPGTQVTIYKSGERDDDLRAILLESSYTADSGIPYNDYLGISTDPDTLGRGSEGSDVLDLQYRLRALGYFSGEPDGKYLGETIIAVKQMQQDLGMSGNGLVSPTLKELIYSADAPTSTNVNLSEGMSGPAVGKLQQNLEVLRLYAGDMDSVYDVEVASAVRAFQQAYGYSADGVAAAEVQKAIAYEAETLVQQLGSGYSCESVSDSVPIAVVSAKTGIRVRSEPSVDSDIMGRVTDGMTLTLAEKGESWSKVQRDGSVGYIKNTYLSFSEQSVTYLKYTGTDGTVYTIGNTAEDYLNGAAFPCDVFSDYLAGGGALGADEGISSYATIETGSDSLRMNLRKDPNTSAEILAELDNGTQLKVLVQGSEWTMVDYQGSEGYLLNDYLRFWTGAADALEEAVVLTEDAEPMLATVNAPGGTADIFEEASDANDRIGYLPHGTEVTVVEVDDDWVLIEFRGHRGYMREAKLEFQFEMEG